MNEESIRKRIGNQGLIFRAIGAPRITPEFETDSFFAFAFCNTSPNKTAGKGTLLIAKN